MEKNKVWFFYKKKKERSTKYLNMNGKDINREKYKLRCLYLDVEKDF